MDIKELINWKNLSKNLTNNDNSVRRDRIPKKYQVKVNYLLQLLEIWDKDIDVWTEKEVQDWLKTIKFPL